MNQLNKVLTLSSAVILFAALGLWLSSNDSSTAAQLAESCCCDACEIDEATGTCVAEDCCCETEDCCAGGCGNCATDCCESGACCTES